MLELLEFIEGGKCRQSLELSWDEDVEAFSVILKWEDEDYNQHEIARKVWPATGIHVALNWMAEQAKNKMRGTP